MATRPSPAKKSTDRITTIGMHSGLYDTAGLDPEMARTLSKGNMPYQPPNMTPALGNPISQVRAGIKHMGTAFSKLLGNRPSTPAEDEHYKQQGEKAFYDAKIQRQGQK